MDQQKYYNTYDSPVGAVDNIVVEYDSDKNNASDDSNNVNKPLTSTLSAVNECTRLLDKRKDSNLSVSSQALQTPLQRFRQAARKVMHVKRASELANFKWKSAPGDAPGLDVHNPPPAYKEYESGLLASIIDYSKENIKISSDMDNESFLKAYSVPRPEWSKVRWINLEGMAFDVLKALAVTHKLHPLALEDLFLDSHTHKLTTKISSFSTSIFMSLELLATENNIKVNSYANPDHWPTLKHHIRDIKDIKIKHSKVQKQRVACQTFHIFLLNDSTVITFFPVDGSLLYKPILNQLRHKDTLLRNAQDASLLVQAIMDVTIDLTAEVVDSYAHQIAQLEELVMSSPKMTYTKVLHLLKGEINNFKQRYSALYGVVNSLIAFEPLESQPEISKKAKVYLTDVLEHSNTIMGEVETLINSAESLIDLIFNLISYDTNESMKYLAVVSCIFLPVTFVAGVYGTNFTNFPELATDEGIWYFWKICIYCTVVCIVLLANGYWLPPILYYFHMAKKYFKKTDKLPTHTPPTSA